MKTTLCILALIAVTAAADVAMPAAGLARSSQENKQRVFYFVHDPRDIQEHEVVKQMITRALFWVTDRNEADYKKN